MNSRIDKIYGKIEKALEGHDCDLTIFLAITKVNIDRLIKCKVTKEQFLIMMSECWDLFENEKLT